VDLAASLSAPAAFSAEAAGRASQLFHLQNDQGPGLGCFRTGQPVAAPGLTAAGQIWPQSAAARAAGFGAAQGRRCACAQVIGALNLFLTTPGELGHEKVRAGHAITDIATIGLLQERGTRHSEILNEQLQGAPNSRVLIEHAKGCSRTEPAPRSYAIAAAYATRASPGTSATVRLAGQRAYLSGCSSVLGSR
jgi:hypothetical protein